MGGQYLVSIKRQSTYTSSISPERRWNHWGWKRTLFRRIKTCMIIATSIATGYSWWIGSKCRKCKAEVSECMDLG
jgi:hypothetical protein